MRRVAASIAGHVLVSAGMGMSVGEEVAVGTGVVVPLLGGYLRLHGAVIRLPAVAVRDDDGSDGFMRPASCQARLGWGVNCVARSVIEEIEEIEETLSQPWFESVNLMKRRRDQSRRVKG